MLVFLDFARVLALVFFTASLRFHPIASALAIVAVSSLVVMLAPLGFVQSIILLLRY